MVRRPTLKFYLALVLNMLVRVSFIKLLVSYSLKLDA